MCIFRAVQCIMSRVPLEGDNSRNLQDGEN